MCVTRLVSRSNSAMPVPMIIMAAMATANGMYVSAVLCAMAGRVEKTMMNVPI